MNEGINMGFARRWLWLGASLALYAAPAAAAVDTTAIRGVTYPGGIVRYYLPGGAAATNLYKDDQGCFATIWEQTWVQSMEPVANYCGPTAVKNVGEWYTGTSAAYADVGQELRTNNWEENAGLWFMCAGACSGDIVVCANVCYAAVTGGVKAGTLPADMLRVLVERAPPGYVLSAPATPPGTTPTQDALLGPLSAGNPVMVLINAGGSLHWAVVTGMYSQGGQTMVRIANSGDRAWTDFLTDWTVQVTDDGPARWVLTALGIVPYIRYNYQASAPPPVLRAPDADGDGVNNCIDNCRYDANPDQLNSDHVGPGDVCDTDDDDDGLLDVSDNCPTTANASQANADRDYLGDVCDTDDDNDAVLDTADNCRVVSNLDQSNHDTDSFGDACDWDDDGDTLADTTDNCRLIANANQADSDGDHVGNLCDNCSALANREQAECRSYRLGTDGTVANSTLDPVSGFPKGKVCDADDADDDCALDTRDNCVGLFNPEQTNSNAKEEQHWTWPTRGDACDTHAAARIDVLLTLGRFGPGVAAGVPVAVGVVSPARLEFDLLSATAYTGIAQRTLTFEVCNPASDECDPFADAATGGWTTQSVYWPGFFDSPGVVTTTATGTTLVRATIRTATPSACSPAANNSRITLTVGATTAADGTPHRDTASVSWCPPGTGKYRIRLLHAAATPSGGTAEVPLHGRAWLDIEVINPDTPSAITSERMPPDLGIDRLAVFDPRHEAVALWFETQGSRPGAGAFVEANRSTLALVSRRDTTLPADVLAVTAATRTTVALPGLAAADRLVLASSTGVLVRPADLSGSWSRIAFATAIPAGDILALQERNGALELLIRTADGLASRWVSTGTGWTTGSGSTAETPLRDPP